MIPDVADVFIDRSRRLLRDDYLGKIGQCIDVLDDDDVWWRANKTSNSVGNLLLHLRGNVTQWIIGGVGKRSAERDRQSEFDERTHRPRHELLDALAKTISEADRILAALDSATLLEPRHIQGYHVTVLEAIFHVVEHFSMHTGQIIMVTKWRTGRDLRLWRPESST
jgi:uncharacterized damage-inducible protein DinB